jgi:hypothetical protein
MAARMGLRFPKYSLIVNVPAPLLLLAFKPSRKLPRLLRRTPLIFLPDLFLRASGSARPCSAAYLPINFLAANLHRPILLAIVLDQPDK